jgi:hypothetical protein
MHAARGGFAAIACQREILERLRGGQRRDAASGLGARRPLERRDFAGESFELRAGVVERLQAAEFAAARRHAQQTIAYGLELRRTRPAEARLELAQQAPEPGQLENVGHVAGRA